MFRLEQLLRPQLTFCAISGVSKKRAIEQASHLICGQVEGLEESTLFSSLIAREKLGSTALGDGIAIPHCRVDGCSSPLVALVTLAEAVDFDAADLQLVDILFFLIVPEEAAQEHLDVLAGLAGLLSQADFRATLRAAGDAASLYASAVSYEL